MSVLTESETTIAQSDWSYEEAFSRNRGLINPKEQQVLRNCRVAIAGMGGVGGGHLDVLARLGVGRFTIADGDVFETVNFNRQYGAKVSTLGRAKIDVMVEAALDINPELDLRVFHEPVTTDSAAEFLRGANLFVDGLDFFAIEIRRLLFRMAAAQGTMAVTAAPGGFGTAWLVFDPAGMSFDRYFDFHDDMDPAEQAAAFAVGLGPKALQRSYFDMSEVDLKNRRGPSSGVACHLACGVVGAEAVKILLHRGRLRPAPFYHHFDPFVGRFVSRRLWGGNRNPWQRIKRHIVARLFRKGMA